ncbi:MAG: S8 family serine peptidase [Pyrinomonadaceae bacterium]
MFQIFARKRLLVLTVVVFCVLSVVLKFGAAGKAKPATALSIPLMSAVSLEALILDPMGLYSSPKIARDVRAEMSNGERASVVVFLADQADVRAAHNMKDQDERGWFVYNTLTEHAARTQADVKMFLTTRGVEFQSFWAANMLVATVDQTLANQIAARSDVARIDSNRPARWVEDPAIADLHIEPDSPETTEWGINNVNAPAVWALGFTGQGIVIANQDTGVRWTHNAIKPKYRGWNGTTADHNFNWFDAIHSGGGICGPNTTAPCDDYGHGTHVTGTTVGDDGAGNQIGVAPGGKWIGCRNMDQGNGTPATYTECFQFFIAPTDLSGNNPNPTLRPHVMNNSWGCPPVEGCTTGAELETIVNNTQAAGIFVEVSAGNAGSECSSVADAPAIYSNSFSTGSININNGLSGFSSRGPSTFYNPNILKPNISAPGSNIRSSYDSSDTDYVNLSGTSMAGPHVCGVIALLWSARPQLVRDIAATKALLQNTANPNVTISTGTQTCGGIPSTQIPNNSFGYGRVDALAAVNAAGGPTATATPSPSDPATQTPTNTATNTPTVLPSPFPEYDLTISQSAPQTILCPGVPLTYTLTVSNVPTPIGGGACPTVRFGYPTTPPGIPFTFTSASGTNGYTGIADVSGVTFTGGCISSANGTTGTATLQVTIRPFGTGTVGTYTSIGSNVVVDPENNWNETNETNNTAATIQTLIGCEGPTPTYTATRTATATNTPTNTSTATATPTPSNLRSRADFDGDGKTDFSVFRQAEGNWYVNRSSAGFFGFNFGLIGDIPIPGDYDGDGKTDFAVFRPDPDEFNPTHFILKSSNNTIRYEYWGVQTDLPLTGDYDGDGKTDMSVYRTSNNTFYITQSSGGTQALSFGAFGDIPLFMDYEGDGKSNIAVFRPGDGTWYIGKPTGVPAQNFYAIQFGLFGDMPVPADYDFDNKDEVAVFRPSEGNWYLLRSSDGGFSALHFGLTGDVPVPGDYDGDGADDVAVYRNGIWYLSQSTAGFGAFQFGLSSDMPIPKQYIP